MSTKEKILTALEASSDFLSGEALSRTCGISRTAVWKQIQRLQEEGYRIESQRKLGYRLVGRSDVLKEPEIRRRLNGEFWNTIYCYDMIDSTNQEARRLLLQGSGQGTVIVAETQTAGRGRRGHTWESRKGKGIWFSFILEPRVGLQETSQYSFVMALAVAAGIQEATGLQAQLKWPNDVLVQGKKVYGILLELVAELSQVQQLIVGIGMNANQTQEEFAPEVQSKAISLAMVLGHPVQRTEVLCAVLRYVETYCRLLEEKGFAAIKEQWMKCSCMMGKKIQVLRNGEIALTGTAVDLDDMGALIVSTAQGQFCVTAGEVSLRDGQGGYTFQE